MRTEEGPRRIGLNRADRLCACHVMWHRIKVSPKPRDCRATSSEPPLVICTWHLGVLVEAYLAPRCQTGTRDSTFAGAATSNFKSTRDIVLRRFSRSASQRTFSWNRGKCCTGIGTPRERTSQEHPSGKPIGTRTSYSTSALPIVYLTVSLLSRSHHACTLSTSTRSQPVPDARCIRSFLSFHVV